MDCRVPHVSSVQVEILGFGAKRRLGNKETSARIPGFLVYTEKRIYLGVPLGGYCNICLVTVPKLFTSW